MKLHGWGDLMVEEDKNAASYRDGSMKRNYEGTASSSFHPFHLSINK